MVSNNLQFKLKRNHAFFCVGVHNVYIFKFISNEITDLRKLDHLWKVTSWKYYPIRHFFSISTLINYVKQKKKIVFLCVLKNFVQFLWALLSISWRHMITSVSWQDWKSCKEKFVWEYQSRHDFRYYSPLQWELFFTLS